MITSLKFTSGYPTALPPIGRRRIDFGERVTILYGPNGAGKSTVLRALAAGSGCGSGGWSRGVATGDLPWEAEVVRDAQPVFYQDCYADSEESFIGADYLEAHAHLRSSGEKRIGLINELIDDIERRFLAHHIGDGRPTILLDEPDNHIGFAGQSILWGGLVGKLSKKYQLIISTHSIFPILLRRTNAMRHDQLIELAEGYAQTCISELGRAIDYFNEAQAPSTPPRGI